MNKEISIFKSTIILYLVVLIIPFGFYFVYESFNTIQQDTKTVSKIGYINTNIQKLYTNIPVNIKKIDQDMNHIAKWVHDTNNQKYYIGAKSLVEDFRNIQSCWESCKQAYSLKEQTKLKHLISQNSALLDNFAIIVEKMVYLKQDAIINIFYISLMIIIILMLLGIYLVRLYIEYQINKHAIYDKETNLYNHDYLMEHLKTTCARATRYKYPLSMLSISISGIDKKTLPENEYRQFMEMVGDMMISLTRTSDVACRYDTRHIAVILPFTELNNAQILKSRIEETFEKQNFSISQKPSFRFSIIEYKPKESPRDYIMRAEKALHN